MRASTPSRSSWRTGSVAAGSAVPVGAGQPVLRAQHLSKSYHSPVLRDLDLDVEQGQFVAIMGPSGSGKSTLLHCLSGILTPTSGEICLGGKNVSGLPDKSRSRLRLKHFGFVFQDGQLVPELPANENVALPLMLSDASRRTAISAADDWLRRLGLEDEANRRPGEMSGGQAQRVAIARALAASPAVVFADEPTGALDSASSDELLDFLTRCVHELGQTIVMVTHSQHDAGFANRIINLFDGQIVNTTRL